MRSISASAPGFVRADFMQEGEDGAWLAAPGVQCTVLHGPYVAAEAGIWRIRALAKPLDHSGEFAWDVFATPRVYAARRAAGVSEAVVRLPDTEVLEFRFTALGAGLKLVAVEMELVLADRDPATPERLQTLVAALSTDCDAEAEALHHLIERLAETGSVGDADRLRRGLREGRPALEARPSDQRSEGVAAAWDRFNTPGAAQSFQPNEGFGYEDAASFIASEPLCFLDIAVLDRSTRETLTGFGYRPEHLQATGLERDLAMARRGWQTRFGYAGETGSRPRPGMFEALVNTDLSYQRGLAQGEGLVAYDPVTGQELRSRHGFVWPFYGLAQTLYRFEGSEVFYVAVGNFPGGRMFIYYPRSRVVAVCEERALRWYPYEQIIREWATAILQSLPEAIRYLGAPARPAAVCGLNNLGHYFWNEMGGLHWAAEENLLSYIQEVVKAPKQYVDAQELAWELAATRSARPGTAYETFRHALEHGLLPIRFSDAQITKAFAERVRLAAHRLAGPPGRPPENAPRPLLWINLRAHNKIWIDQSAGFAEILNAIYDEYGAAAAFIDGTSDCAEIMADIRARTRAEVPLYDGLNVSVFDSLNWAFQVDAYICTVGSGLALVNWLANKPGVAHAEHGHLRQKIWWCYARADLIAPLFPDYSQVVDKGEGWYCNYEVDWQVLYDLLRQSLIAAGFKGTESRSA